jgi:hypothetical protein
MGMELQNPLHLFLLLRAALILLDELDDILQSRVLIGIAQRHCGDSVERQNRYNLKTNTHLNTFGSFAWFCVVSRGFAWFCFGFVSFHHFPP